MRDLKGSEGDDTDQPPSAPPPLPPKTSRSLKAAGKVRKEAAKEGGNPLTVRVVVMGDDRVLGKLSRAYRSLRLDAFCFCSSVPFLFTNELLTDRRSPNIGVGPGT